MAKLYDGSVSNTRSFTKAFDYRKFDFSDVVIQKYKMTVKHMFADVCWAVNLVIRNNHITLKTPITNGDIPEAVILKSSTNALIEGNIFEDFRKVDKPGYDNGDGSCEERTSIGTTWRNNQFLNSTDGGLDTKGQNVLIIGNLSDGAYRGFRLWGNGSLYDNTTRNVQNAHIWFDLGADVSGDWSIYRHQFFGTSPHLRIDAGQAGRVITLVDPVVDGVPVTDIKQLTVVKSGTGTKVQVVLHVTPKEPVYDFVLKDKLEDSDNNGFITLSKKAATLGVKKGTVLKYIGLATGGYAYNKVP